MAGELLSSQHNQLSALHTWLRCLLVCHIYPLSCDSHVTELTRLLPRLPIVASFIQVQCIYTLIFSEHGV